MQNWLIFLILVLLLYLLIRKGAAEAKHLQVIQQDIYLSGWPKTAAGWKLLHLTDIHFRDNDTLGEMLVELVQLANPDCIIITGDLLYPEGEGQAEAIEFLKKLAELFPTFIVPGNKDHLEKTTHQPYEDWYNSGVTMLINDAIAFPLKDNKRAWIAGVNDPHTGNDDLQKALAKVPEGEICLLLAHSPDIILREGIERVAAIFSGHTHGGQICLPGGKALYSNTKAGLKYASGVIPAGKSNTQLVVSRGVSATRLRIRLFCPPELTLWTIRPKEGKI
jgi:uncharacterized protein